MLLLLLIHPPQTHEFMSCSPGSVAVWKHSAPCTYWIAKVLCCVWVLSCASWFCPWLLQDKKKDSSSFHPLLTGHNEGEKPPSQCAAYILWLQHVTHPYRESFFYVFDVCGVFFMGSRGCADFTGCRIKSEAVIICGWGLHLSHLLLRDVLSNYDPIVGCCVLSAPPRPKLRQVRRRRAERHRKRGELSFRIEVDFSFSMICRHEWNILAHLTTT